MVRYKNGSQAFLLIMLLGIAGCVVAAPPPLNTQSESRNGDKAYCAMDAPIRPEPDSAGDGPEARSLVEGIWLHNQVYALLCPYVRNNLFYINPHNKL